MGHTRPRFNKAREEQLQARREGKKKARVQDEQPENAGDAEIIIPRTAAEKARAKEQREIQEQVSGGPGSSPLAPLMGVAKLTLPSSWRGRVRPLLKARCRPRSESEWTIT